MNCELCHERLQQNLDGHPAIETPEMELHLVACADCAALYAASRRLNAGLRLLTTPQPPLAFTERLVAAVLADQRAQRSRGRMRLAVYALAASLLFGMGAVSLYSSGWVTFGKQEPEKANVVANDPPKPDMVKQSPAPSMRESVTDAGTALASLTTRTADETVGQTRLLVPMVTGPSLDELDSPPGAEPTKSYLEAGQGVSVALEPVTNSAQRAVNLFRRDLPHVERSEKP